MRKNLAWSSSRWERAGHARCAVRAWLVPAHWLMRSWNAFSDMSLPDQLAELLETLESGQGINLYLRI